MSHPQHQRRLRSFLENVAALFVVGVVPGGLVFAQIDFSTQVRPILAKNCGVCHGPDEQESGLNLLDPEVAFAELASGNHAIVAGDLAGSELWTRVTTTENEWRMPPDGKPLGSRELSVIRRWIERALWLVLQRIPTDSEIERGVAFVNELRLTRRTELGHEGLAALETFCLMAMNLNEFLFLD